MSRWSSPVVHGVAVALLAFLAYAGTLGNGFSYDDRLAVEPNPVIRGDAPIGEAFTRDFWGQPADRTVASYRPIALASLAVDARLGGGAPQAMHAGNVLWHVATTVALWAVARGPFGPAVALGAAGLFAVLAGPSEAVEAIVGRADLLVTFFLLLGWAAHRRRTWGGTAAAAGCLLLALGSKESAVVAPLLWWLLEMGTDTISARGSPGAAASRRDRLLPLALYLLPLALYLLGRQVALGSALATLAEPLRNPLAAADLPGRVLGAGRIFLERYLAGIADPLARAYDCSAPACGPATASDPVAWAGLAVLAALAALPFLAWRRLPAVAAGTAWFVLTFLPASNLVIPGPTVYAERLSYLPAAGLCLALAGAAHAVARRLPRPAIAWALLAVLGAGNAAALQVRHGDWASYESLFLADLDRMPGSAVVQYNAAFAYTQRNDLDRAEAHARRAIALAPGYVAPRGLLAAVLDLTGRPDEARATFEDAFRVGRTAQLHLEFATFLARHGDPGRAAKVARDGLELDPTHPGLRSLLDRLAR